MIIVEQIPVINLGLRDFDKQPGLSSGRPESALMIKNLRDNKPMPVPILTLSSDNSLDSTSEIVFPPRNPLVVHRAPKRTPGLHVSGLIRSAALRYGLLKPKTRQQKVSAEKEQEFLAGMNASMGIKPAQNFSAFGGGGTGATFEEDVPIIVFMGLYWEDRLQQQYPNMCYHIGEFELDGIYMSPDGIEEWADIWFVDEIKLTYKSMSTPFEFQTLYHMQTKAYCKRMKTNYCRFHVLYVNGNYTDIRGPQYRIYDVTYTLQEINSNWDFLLRHRDKLSQEGTLHEIVEPGSGY